MIEKRDVSAIMRSVAQVVRECVSTVKDALSARIEALETKLGELSQIHPVKGDKGEKGDKGDTGDRGESGNPGIQGERGERGEPGQRGEDGPVGPAGARGDPGIAGKDGERGECGPQGPQGLIGERGERGEAGIQGPEGRSIQLSEVEPLLDQAVDRHVSRWALEFERRAQEQFQRAIDRMPLPKDGRDAFQLEDLSVSDDGHGNVTFKFQRDGLEKSFAVRVPCFEYMGAYREGDPYLRGHGVSYAGSLWIALGDNPDGKPADSSKSWQLAVKRGRDGNDLREVDANKLNTREPVRLK